MGCYVTADGKPKDACVLDPRYNVPNTYYIFNHVDLTIAYRNMAGGNVLDEKRGGRIISIKASHQNNLSFLNTKTFVKGLVFHQRPGTFL